MIYIKSRLHASLPLERYKKILERLCEYEGYAGWDISLWCTTDKMIRRFNKTFRGVDTATDILSFSLRDGIKPGQRVKQIDDVRELGDLIISIHYVQRFCAKEDVAFDERMTVLLVHGFCHLLGYDHCTEEEYEHMAVKEQVLVKALL